MDRQNLREADALRLLAQGDVDAFKYIFNHYSGGVYYVALKYLTAEEAEDIVQEVFTKVWGSRHLFRDVLNLEAYLSRMTATFCCSYIKKSVKQAKLNYEHLA